MLPMYYIQQVCFQVSQYNTMGMYEKIQKALDCIANIQSIVDTWIMCSMHYVHMRITLCALARPAVIWFAPRGERASFRSAKAGPPLLPGLMAASIWMPRSLFDACA